ncbi:Aste57867_3025 [Aphanomyces stellatus]|uniref:Aste57867_3025 protein n=1 Tax=Aphanomyces stellatus TaxID=120398 RepID=A0A485KBB5_9STRA|nr:hypothetical protein As57867_003016 [Aphanomyces stellatus]VFT80205.1 Aste57867_3025 [Aphanomyces stellatus]
MVPPEVLLKIGFLLPDAASFFSFLEALDAPAARGPFFESLWQLGSSGIDRSHLWPSLTMTGAIFQTPRRLALVESVLGLYSNVKVMGRCDLGWLHNHLRPSNSITWNALFPSASSDTNIHGAHVPLDEWYTMWAVLPITNLDLVAHPSRGYSKLNPFAAMDEWGSDAEQCFYAVLPQCLHLAALSFVGTLNLSVIFNLAAQSSSSLVELNLTSSHVYPSLLSAAELTHATQWLATTPVRRFCIPKVTFGGDVDTTVRNAFFSALLSCPSMEVIEGTGWDLTALETAILPITLGTQRLMLHQPTVTPSSLITLAHAVCNSTAVMQLTLTGYKAVTAYSREDYGSAFQVLMEAVTHSSVTSLDVTGCYLHDCYWPRLGPMVQTSKLQTLTLKRNEISDEGVAWIAQAIQANLTLTRVELDDNLISSDGVLRLLNSGADRPRPLSLSLLWNYGGLNEDVNVKLRALATDWGVNLEIATYFVH